MYDSIINGLISYSIQNSAIEFKHYGVGHLNGGHSGRYPYGSGKDPFQRDKVARTKWKEERKAVSGARDPRLEGLTRATSWEEWEKDAHYVNGRLVKKSRVADVYETEKLPKKSQNTMNINDTKRNRMGELGNDIGTFIKLAYLSEIGIKGSTAIYTSAALGVAPSPFGFVLLYPIAAHGVRTAVDFSLYKKNEARKDKLPKDEETGFHLKEPDDPDIAKAIQKDMNLSNFPTTGDFPPGSMTNTSLCAMAYDMRRRGYDVNARPLYAPLKKEQFANFYSDARFMSIIGKTPKGGLTSSPERREKIVNSMSKVAENSRGIMRVETTLGGAHDLVYEKRNGKTYVGDPMKGNMYDMSNKKDSDRCLRFAKNVSIMRTDNRTPNLRRMHEACE